MRWNMEHHEKIPYDRLIQIAYDCICYIGYDNDNMTETLQTLRLSAEELLEIDYIPCNRHILENKAVKNRLVSISSNQALNASQLPEIAFEEKFREKYSTFSKNILSGVITKSNMMKMLEDFVKNVM